MSDVAARDLTWRNGQRADVGHKIVARICAIEEIEELHERFEAGALTQLEVAANPQVHLCQRRSAKFVQRGLPAVDHSAVIGHAVAIDINARSERVRACAFKL